MPKNKLLPIIILLLLIIILLDSCHTTKQASVQKYIVTDSQTIKTDSIYIDTSVIYRTIYINQKGDGTRETKIKEIIRNNIIQTTTKQEDNYMHIDSTKQATSATVNKKDSAKVAQNTPLWCLISALLSLLTIIVIKYYRAKR